MYALYHLLPVHNLAHLQETSLGSCIRAYVDVGDECNDAADIDDRHIK